MLLLPPVCQTACTPALPRTQHVSSRPWSQSTSPLQPYLQAMPCCYANKNTGSPAECEFQISNEELLTVSMSQILHGRTHTKNDALFTWQPYPTTAHSSGPMSFQERLSLGLLEYLPDGRLQFLRHGLITLNLAGEKVKVSFCFCLGGSS